MCVTSCRALMFAKMCNVLVAVLMPMCSTAHLEKEHPVVLCRQVASDFFHPDIRPFLRFAQTLPSDLAMAKDQEEACHYLPPLSSPTSHHVPPYMGCGHRCPGWSSLSRSHHSWSGCCQRGDGLPHMEKGVALFCSTHTPLLAHSHQCYKLNRGATPVPPVRLSHTRSQDPAPSADLVSSPHTGMTNPKKLARDTKSFCPLTGGRKGIK